MVIMVTTENYSALTLKQQPTSCRIDSPLNPLLRCHFGFENPEIEAYDCPSQPPVDSSVPSPLTFIFGSRSACSSPDLRSWINFVELHSNASGNHPTLRSGFIAHCAPAHSPSPRHLLRFRRRSMARRRRSPNQAGQFPN